MTTTQAENEKMKAEIMNFMMSGAHRSVSEIKTGIPSLSGKSIQRISAIMRLLKLEGKVEKEVINGETYFFLN